MPKFTLKSLTGNVGTIRPTRIEGLYQAVHNLWGYPPELLRFIARGRRLPHWEDREIKRNRRLSNYGLLGGETIYLILRLGPDILRLGPGSAIPLGPYRAARYRSHPMKLRAK